MTDREKVIKGLEETETMLAQAVDRGGEMAVMGAFKCLNHVTDALTMLKEQKPKTAITNPEKYGDYLKHCPSCETVLPISSQYGRTKFCHLCGQAVKWNEVD